MSPDDSMVGELREVAEVLWIPIIELKPVEGSSVRALKALKLCDKVMFTSPRALKVLLEDASNHGLEESIVNALKNSYIAVNGPKTAECIERILSKKPDHIASKPYSKTLAEELVSIGVDCIVSLRSSEAVRDAEEILRGRGVKLYNIPIYEPRIKKEVVEAVREVICAGEIDIIALTSPIIAKAACEIISNCWRRNLKIVIIGETTFKNIPRECLEMKEFIVGDGTPKSLKEIIKRICASKEVLRE